MYKYIYSVTPGSMHVSFFDSYTHTHINTHTVSCYQDTVQGMLELNRMRQMVLDDNEHYFQNTGNSLTTNIVDRNYSTIGLTPQMRTLCMFSFCFHLCMWVVSMCTRTLEPWILSNKLYWGFYGHGVFVLERILGCVVLYWGLECTIKVYLFVNAM